LVAARASADRQLKLECLVDDRGLTDDADQPGADQLVELYVDYVDVHVLGAYVHRTDTDRDLLQAVGWEHERVTWFNNELIWVR